MDVAMAAGHRSTAPWWSLSKVAARASRKDPAVANGPSTITVIRHGEKPADGEPKPPHGIDSAGEKHPSSLITRGWQRAGALAVILGGQRPPAALVRPTVLVSPDYGPETRFHRTSQTILPLAERLGLTPVHPARTGHEAHVVKHAILPATGHVLVCWEHHHIPDIMAALADKLGITQLPSIARKWPDDDFDSVLVVTVEPTPTVVVASQNALAGDARSG